MANNDSKYAWEEWQLTAYLLGELEPGEAAQMAAAAQNDQQLAKQLQELSKTLDDVKAVLGRDGASSSDQAALSALKAGFSSQGPGEAKCDEAVEQVGGVQVGGAPVAAPTFTLRRLVTRWENWLSLAGLLLIGVLLYQRPGRNDASFALLESSGPISIPTSKPREQLSLDSSVVHEAWNQSPQSNPIAVSPGPSSPAANAGGSMMGMGSQPGYGGMGGGMASGGMTGGGMGIGAGMMGGGEGGGMGSEGIPGGAMKMDRAMAAGMGEGELAQAPTDAAFPQKSLAANIAGGSVGAGMGGVGDQIPQPTNLSTNLSMVVPHNESRRSRAEFEQEDVDRFRSRQYDSQSGDRFASFSDNDFLKVDDQPLSTFSIDVDTASYSKARQYLLEQQQVPPPAAVRIEEFINYFDYEYAGPKDDKPFAASLAVTDCPWQPKHQLVRIALQAKQVERADRPKANLVFLLDVSGSMNQPNKLPLVKETMRLLTYQLTENDKVAMVVYAGAAGCVLESTYGHEQDKILAAIERLNAGGSTNGAQGIQLAYKIARENFIEGGINRVLLCTDGDFNVGVTSTNALVDMVKEQAQSHVFLTVLGYGNGNTNDAMMEQIADRGNGLYGFVDSRREAQRQMVKQLAGNLMTVAKDVKIQVEFNPAKVRSYRLIGYENRQLAAEDFNNDKKDAGEIGAGHRVTAIYELVPMREESTESPLIDGLRYQANKRPETVAPVNSRTGEASDELLAVKLRYKQPEGSESQLLTFPLEDKSVAYAEIDKDFRWAAAMAEFGMLLRQSPHKGQATWATLSQHARSALGNPVDPARAETVEMINTASRLLGY